jgi:hypothetical protein
MESYVKIATLELERIMKKVRDRAEFLNKVEERWRSEGKLEEYRQRMIDALRRL